MGGRIDTCQAARAEHLLRAVAELELDLALVDEVELLLAVVVVKVASDSGREDERVHAELLDVELAADLAESGRVAQRVE